MCQNLVNPFARNVFYNLSKIVHYIMRLVFLSENTKRSQSKAALFTEIFTYICRTFLTKTSPDIWTATLWVLWTYQRNVSPHSLPTDVCYRLQCVKEGQRWHLTTFLRLYSDSMVKQLLHNFRNIWNCKNGNSIYFNSS